MATVMATFEIYLVEDCQNSYSVKGQQLIHNRSVVFLRAFESLVEIDFKHFLYCYSNTFLSLMATPMDTICYHQ